MQSWSPITDEEFAQLFTEQYNELTDADKLMFEKYRVPPWKALIRRSEITGDEYVFVVAQITTPEGNGVLYFDDVEYGFNASYIDSSQRILQPGGSQATLKQVVSSWSEHE